MKEETEVLWGGGRYKERRAWEFTSTVEIIIRKDNKEEWDQGWRRKGGMREGNLLWQGEKNQIREWE
jgi:hypothetical protein